MKTLREYLAWAEEKQVALGHFNISDSEGFKAVVEAAQILKVPTIVGISEGEREFLGLKEAVALVKTARENGLPIFLNADHTYSVEKSRTAIDAGVDSIIIDEADKPYEENVRLTKEVVNYARAKGAGTVVEGELGFIGQSSKIMDKLPEGVSEKTQTDPQEAAKFVQETGVDLFAPSVGNIHGMIKTGNPKLNIERIKSIKLAEEIRKFFKGEVYDDELTLKKYSRDASLFEVKPKLVVFPKDTDDLKALVKWIGDNPGHSVTVRAAGSDMTGGPLNESIIADVSQHMNHADEIIGESVAIQPGVFYRDFEKQTLAKGLILPCFPASKNLCALGGMISNNCAGERTLRYGKMENYVLESKIIFSDGKEYSIKPLNQTELEVKMAQEDFEGNIYKSLFELIEKNREILDQANPKVSKNSAGYYLWNIWNGEIFDLNKLIVGSQGTLGIITEAKIKLIPEKAYHDMIALFFQSWNELPQVVNAILPYGPESLETFDDETLKLGIHSKTG